MSGLLFPELELSKNNLLTHFVKVSMRDEITIKQAIANALDYWRNTWLRQMKSEDLVEMISEMRRYGQKAYADQTNDELIDQLWEELIENSEHKTIDALIKEYDFLD